MSSPNKAYRVIAAGPEHDPGLDQLLAESPFDGPVAVSFLRRPSVLASYHKESQDRVIYVLLEPKNDQVVGLGAVTLRRIWLKGQVVRLAYLSGLRITPAHQRAFFQIPQMYQAMYDSLKNRVDLFITTIVSSNQAAIQMFEKKRRSMPEYRFQGEVETFFLGPKKTGLMPTVSAADWQPSYDGAVAEPDWLSSLGADLLKTDTTYGYVIKPDWKQYHVFGYRGIYRLMPFLATDRLGWPRFPKARQTADFLAGGIYGQSDLKDMVQQLRGRAAGADFVMLSAWRGSALAEVCRRLTPVVYASRLYQVLFPGQAAYDLSNMAIDVVFL